MAILWNAGVSMAMGVPQIAAGLFEWTIWTLNGWWLGVPQFFRKPPYRLFDLFTDRLCTTGMVKHGETGWNRLRCHMTLHSVGWREMTGNCGLCYPKIPSPHEIPQASLVLVVDVFISASHHRVRSEGAMAWILRAWDPIRMNCWWITYICASLVLEVPIFLLAKSTFFLVKSMFSMFLVGEISLSGDVPRNVRTMGDFNPSAHPSPAPLTASDSPAKLGQSSSYWVEFLWDTMIIIWEMCHKTQQSLLITS